MQILILQNRTSRQERRWKPQCTTSTFRVSRLLGQQSRWLLLRWAVLSDGGTESLQTTLKELHAEFIKQTGQDRLPYPSCERRWLDWHNAGFTQDDLTLVLDHIRRMNAKQDFKLSIRFGSLIGDLERFGDLLGEASAQDRKRKYRAENSYPPNKAQALRDTHRPDAPPEPNRLVTSKEALDRTLLALKEGVNGALDSMKKSP